MPSRFTDRTEAGRSLAAQLQHLAGQDVIVLALPRGGLPVAYEIGRSLRAPLDVLNVRNLGVPWQEELAMGAVATGGVRVLNDEIVHLSSPAKTFRRFSSARLGRCPARFRRL